MRNQERGTSGSAPGTPTSQSRTGHGPKRQRRKYIPEKPNYSINLWSIMKNCIGKELTKIPMPVSLCIILLYLLGQN